MSEVCRPSKFVTHCSTNWKEHCSAEFGLYVEAHEDRAKTNGMELRTFTGVYLGTVDNILGTLKVFDIKTGMVHNPRNMNVLLIPDDVILAVNAWGCWFQQETEPNQIP